MFQGQFIISKCIVFCLEENLGLGEILVMCVATYQCHCCIDGWMDESGV